MAKKRNEEEPVVTDFTLDTTVEETPQEVIPVSELNNTEVVNTAKVGKSSSKTLVNCLRKEKIIVRHIQRQQGTITNPKHVLYGGMAMDAKRKFTVPKKRDGSYVDVLTDNEKDFLEDIMGLEPNHLSIYRKVDNYWNAGENPASMVELRKQDLVLDLSDPAQYIKYKILLANKDRIAPSLQALSDSPKQTYQFVLINENEETRAAKRNMTNIQRCYKEFGKIEEDRDTLRLVVETLSGRPTAANVSTDFLQTQANDLIQADSKTFLAVVTDPLLQTKVLIKKAVEEGLISQKAGQFYHRESNTPLCEYGEEATLSNAAKYLNHPKHQDMLFALQAKLK